MRIQFSEQAIHAIGERLGDHGFLKLTYDSDGCGCAVNGVPALWIVSETTPDDEQMDSNGPAIWISKHQKVFFEDEMKIDVIPLSKVYRLSSSQQIYSTAMTLIDHQ